MSDLPANLFAFPLPTFPFSGSSREGAAFVLEVGMEEQGVQTGGMQQSDMQALKQNRQRTLIADAVDLARPW